VKITVWIRPDEATGELTERVDYKLESRDTLQAQRFGFKLIRAMTGKSIDAIATGGVGNEVFRVPGD
jgi:hypothetical protein